MVSGATQTPYLYSMNRNRNGIVLGLIITSLLALVVLQVLWLQNIFEKTYIDYERNTNSIFRNTVFALRDSLLEKNIVALPPDTLDSIPVQTISRVTVMGRGVRSPEPGRSDVRIYLSPNSRATWSGSPRDSISTILRPLASKLEKASRQFSLDGTSHSFIIRMEPDSIPRDSLHLYLQRAFAKAGYDCPFVIHHEATSPEVDRVFVNFPEGGQRHAERAAPRVWEDTIHTDPIRLNPLHRYSASILEVRSHLLSKLSPHILFSLFLTLTTASAFFFLYRNLRSQQRLMEIKNDFINNISHELKTPVATVSVAIEALQNFNGLNNPKLTEEYLSIAQHELTRLSLMTDKILKTSVFEKNGVTFTHEVVDLETLTSQVLNSFKLIVDKNGGQLTLLKEGSNFVIQGSETHLTNVLYNLVDNAFKYSRSHPMITVTLREQGDHVQLSVEDKGIGIPHAYQKKIFEKFFRVPTGNVHNIKGYGLGLSYVSSVVASHGGTIDLKSSPGLGSTFIIDLPK